MKKTAGSIIHLRVATLDYKRHHLGVLKHVQNLAEFNIFARLHDIVTAGGKAPASAIL